MPLVPNIRLDQPAQPMPEPEDVEIQQGDDIPEYDDKGAIIRITHGDGSVTVSLDGSPLVEPENKHPKGFYDNLVDDIDEMELGRISDDLLRGVEEDLRSREEWVQERAQGIRLLGLKMEVPGIQGAADGAPVEGMSKVRHPLLQEAVLRFQANARAELLPTDGPVKIRNDNNSANLNEDTLANALEKDLNHYLTATASEYYPDTDRMLFMLGFGGTAFKKVYFCPLRNRPVSESVDADDLIVNNSTTDLRNAKRITHRTYMRPSVVKRLQILGVYRDTDLATPLAPKYDAVQLEKNQQQGLSAGTMRPDDRDREIYEIYCELDIKGFEHKYKGKETGLEIPYRVTIDVSSRRILSIVRNYTEDEDNELPDAKTTFVKYTFVPGMGFYDIGLLHILGNTTNAVTAAWRELLDAGMYACFPGFLIADTGARQNTNIFRVPPGGGALVKTGGLPINQAIMPLPYQGPNAALMSLVENMAQTGMRVGGTAEQAVGEGVQDAPVGTTLALIDQATKVMNSVHKRMHAAQAEEFRLLVECFRENPQSFWQRNGKPAYQWDEQTFLQALEDCELTPQSDPNTASQVQRLMKLAALKQLQAASPTMYDPIAIDSAVIKALGFSNPEQFMAPPNAQAAPPPEMQKMQAESQAKTKMADAKMLDAQTKAELAKAKAMEIQAKAAEMGARLQMDTQKHMRPEGNTIDMVKARATMLDAQTRAKQVEMKRGEIALTDANAQEDRHSREKLELLQLAKEVLLHPNMAPVAEPIVKSAEKDQSNA